MKRQVQNLGKALMQPVAVMPLAALLMGIGYAIDPVAWGGKNPVAAFLIAAGAAILDNLGIIFAIGVAYGLSKDKNGASALAGLVSFLTVTKMLNQGTVAMLKSIEKVDPQLGFDKINNGNVFIGIIVGILAAWVYNHFHKVKLPVALSFFSGRRLVPILTGLFSLVLSVILFFVWPFVYSALVSFGKGILSLGAVGAGIYGFFNRLLIPTGLHHALNNVFWFDGFGLGDLPNFWNQAQKMDAIAQIQKTLPSYVPGFYMAGFFPIMMFGLPAACLAMFMRAKTSQKKTAFALLFAGAIASFVTGVTEPVEFAFMFLAPVLYVIHALLTGISVAIAAAMHWTSGFGFSAGLIDYILGFNLPTALQPYMLIVQGIFFGAIYFLIFYFLIPMLDLKTPGREEIDENEGRVLDIHNTDFTAMAKQILKGLGGKENIAELDNCVTRLRVNVKDYLLVDEAEIKKANISGVIRPSKDSVQVIVGPQVEFVKDEIDKFL